MRSHLPPHVFFQKMKKKPALQAIIDNLDNYSIDELEKVQGQPKWIREQLVRMKKEKDTPEKTPDFIAEHLADMMDGDPEQDRKNREQEYEIRRWVGGDWKMPAGITGGFTVDIQPGDCFLVYSPRHVKIQSSISNMNPQQWNYFQRYTEYVGMMNTTEFAKFVSAGLAKQHPNATEVVLDDNLDPNVKNMGLFRIQRH